MTLAETVAKFIPGARILYATKDGALHVLTYTGDPDKAIATAIANGYTIETGMRKAS